MTRPSAGQLALSVLAAVLAVATSLAGILWAGAYARETAAWAVQGVGQDVANLPVAIALAWSAERLRGRDSLPALCVWLGSLAYLLYAFAIYAFAVHFGSLFLAYVAVLGLSFHAFAGTLAGLDVAVATAPLRDHPDRGSAGLLLIAIGVVFAGLWLGEDVPHVLANTPPPSLGETGLVTNPVHVLDLALVLPAMVVAGVQLRRQRPWGLLFAPVLLVFSVTMGAAILALFAMSALRGLPVAGPAVVVVAAIVLSSAAYAGRLLRPRGKRK
jgi:hypothetical protein